MPCHPGRCATACLPCDRHLLHAGCEHLRNDHGVIVDFNTADPLIRWDSYESLSAGGEGTSGCHRPGPGRDGDGGLLTVCSGSASFPEILTSLGVQSAPPQCCGLGEPVKSRLGDLGWHSGCGLAGLWPGCCPAPGNSLGRNVWARGTASPAPFTLGMDTSGPGAVTTGKRLCRAPPQKRPHTGPRKDGGLLPGQQE